MLAPYPSDRTIFYRKIGTNPLNYYIPQFVNCKLRKRLCPEFEIPEAKEPPEVVNVHMMLNGRSGAFRKSRAVRADCIHGNRKPGTATAPEIADADTL